jgi:hypothetical protein
VWELAADGDQRTRVSQTYDWSAFSHLDMLDYLPVVDETQLRSSLDKLADALGCSGRSQTDDPGWVVDARRVLLTARIEKSRPAPMRIAR